MNVAIAFTVVVALLALGQLFARWRVLPDATPDVLNRVVLYACLPAAILLNVPRLEPAPALAGLAVLPWLLLALGVIGVRLAARVWQFDAPTKTVLLLAVPLGNTSFLGYPLTAALLGAGALPYAVIYDQLGSFLMLSTYGLVLLAAAAHGARPGPLAIARRVLTFPPFIALVLAATVVPATLPVAIERVLEALSFVLLPLVTLALGLQMQLALPREHRAALAVGLAGKLLVLPLVALVLARWVGLDGLAYDVAVIESAMPTMMTAMALAAAARLAPELAAALVAYGLLASIVTLPLWRLVLA